MRPLAQLAGDARIAKHNTLEHELPPAVDGNQSIAVQSALAVVDTLAVVDNDLVVVLHLVHLDPSFEDEVVGKDVGEAGGAQALPVGDR